MKQTRFVTVRLDDVTYNKLSFIATKNRWSLSQVIREILLGFFSVDGVIDLRLSDDDCSVLRQLSIFVSEGGDPE